MTKRMPLHNQRIVAQPPSAASRGYYSNCAHDGPDKSGLLVQPDNGRIVKIQGGPNRKVTAA